MTKRQEKRKNAKLNSTPGRNTPVYFTIGGNGVNDFGVVVAPPRSFKSCSNYLRKNPIK